MNRKGFTLVELLATLTILGIIIAIGGISISAIMNNAKEKQFELLVSNIKSAVENYYQECTYGGSSCNYEISFQYLLDNGYISPNKDKKLVNPKTDGDITSCKISYSFTGNKFVIRNEPPTNANCPTNDDYNS